MGLRDRLTIITSNPWPWIAGSVVVGALLFTAWCGSYSAGKAREAEGRAQAAKEEIEALRAADEAKQQLLDEATEKFDQVAREAQARIQELQDIVDSSRARARSLERSLESERSRSRPIIEAVRNETSSDLGDSTQALLRESAPGAMFVLDTTRGGFFSNREAAVQIKQSILEVGTLRSQADMLGQLGQEKDEQIEALRLTIDQQDMRFAALDDRVGALEDSLSHERELTAALTRQLEAREDQIKHMRRAGRMRTVLNVGGLAAAIAIVAATR